MLKASSLKLPDTLRVLRKEVGGSPMVGFTASDAYNALARAKANKLEGDDCHKLIKYFTQRNFSEVGFYYDFEHSEEDGILSFFWIDGRMKRDYEFFGDLLVFYTTYRTNKYDMICAPFVGMNHHGNNVIYILKYCEIAGEFEYHWPREMWCPAYSKNYWSDVVLSSQRCETTNKSVSHQLNKTQGLCDFYHVFMDVISEWKNKENCHDYRSCKGNIELAAVNSGLLLHARKIYTIKVYVLFEEQFLKRMVCSQEEKRGIISVVKSYYVWRPKKYLIKHEVRFNQETFAVECICQFFTEMGFLCSHSLCVYHVHCVLEIPNLYIMKRWTKAALCSHVVEDDDEKSNIVAASVWRAVVNNVIDTFARILNDDPDQSVKINLKFYFSTIPFNMLCQNDPYGGSQDSQATEEKRLENFIASARHEYVTAGVKSLKGFHLLFFPVWSGEKEHLRDEKERKTISIEHV
ncbi:protein FAR1-RELATED SEQUENCE 5-like [Spinacia oleracea]|uniref:Protein FAR1-RELATED SEQUENCE 5-like n=1 Tax=Spinacia oleracea TaxID=3562 RepID=A0ABM3RJE0_SPIOL|nr:protein FAR1-RELATED SEQUENCE 5-like [Spinacia oleracea]